MKLHIREVKEGKRDGALRQLGERFKRYKGRWRVKRSGRSLRQLGNK